MATLNLPSLSQYQKMVKFKPVAQAPAAARITSAKSTALSLSPSHPANQSALSPPPVLHASLENYLHLHKAKPAVMHHMRNTGAHDAAANGDTEAQGDMIAADIATSAPADDEAGHVVSTDTLPHGDSGQDVTHVATNGEVRAYYVQFYNQLAPQLGL